MTTGASWPWNLSTVPTRAPDRGAPEQRHLGVVGGDDQDRSRPSGCCLPLPFVQAAPGAVRRSTMPADRLDLLRTSRSGCRRGRPARTRARRRRRARCRCELLPLELRPRAQPAVVEHLRGELRRSPGAGARSRAGRGRGRRRCVSLLPEDVLERRDPAALRVAPLLRLLELLRVAEQHERPAGLGDGQRVGERHLPGLVDEEDVDALEHLLARPEPGRARPRPGPRRPRAPRAPPGCSVTSRMPSGSVLGAIVDLLDAASAACRASPPPRRPRRAGCGSPCGCSP